MSTLHFSLAVLSGQSKRLLDNILLLELLSQCILVEPGTLALHTVEKRIINKRVSNYWQEFMTSSSWRDGHWLLAYEAEFQGWLTSRDPKNHIESDEYFKVLKENNISFYDKDVDYSVSASELEDSYEEDVSDDENDKNDDLSDDSDDLPF